MAVSSVFQVGGVVKRRFRIGIVGLSAVRGWATAAHVPALRALSDDFEIVGVANTTLKSAESAAAAFGLPRAFESAAALIASPEIDVVIVTVKVPHHREVVTAALQNSKSVYCEWPLATGLTEALELAKLANDNKVLAVIGTQAVASPEIQFVRDKLADGYVGEVLSSTYIGAGSIWGDEVSLGEAYAMDSTNRATLLSVIGGHALAAVQRVLGPIDEVGAVLSQRRQTVRIIETGEMIPMKTPDQVAVHCVLESGAPLSLQLRGGLPRGARLLWEIHGTEGDLRMTARSEHVPVINISPLRVEAGRRGEIGFSECDIPSSSYYGVEDATVSRNVAGLYRLMAQDLRHGTHTAPNFEDAVSIHRTLHAIEQSAHTGRRVFVNECR
jgi:predicted dehydrogenase